MDTTSALSEPVRGLLRLGQPSGPWRDYRTLGLTNEHVPELIRVMGDEELDHADSDDHKVWAPLHAWRALAQLGATKAAGPFLEELIHDPDDDWRYDDAAEFFALLGPSTIDQVAEFLADGKNKRDAAHF